MLIGASTGFVIGLTSAGSGTLIAVFLIAYYRLAPKHVVGTDVFHAAVLLGAASIAHIVAGNVDFGLVGAILLGSIAGVWLGSHMILKLPTGVLRTALGLVMVAASIALFEKAGLGFTVAIAVLVPVVLLGLAGMRALVPRPRATRGTPVEP